MVDSGCASFPTSTSGSYKGRMLVSSVARIHLAFALAGMARAEILVSNISTNRTGTAASEQQPEEVRVDDRRPSLAESFAVPEGATGFWLTNVVLSMSYSGTGAAKAVLTLWSSMQSPGNSAALGLPMPQRALAYVATRTFAPGTSFDGYQQFTA